jgi:hypothetical protein
VENQKQVSHFPTAPILFLSKPKATAGFPTTERGGKNNSRQTEKILDAEHLVNLTAEKIVPTTFARIQFDASSAESAENVELG